MAAFKVVKVKIAVAVLKLLNSVIYMSIRSCGQLILYCAMETLQDEDSSSQAKQLLEPLDAYREVVAGTEVSTADLPF